MPQTLISESYSWYVGFYRYEELKWWERLFTSQEWGHCFCFSQLGPFVQIVAPNRDGIRVGIQSSPDGTAMSIDEYARFMYNNGVTIVKIEHIPEELNYRSIFAPTCVSAVKTILGYNTSMFCLSPKAFCIDLLKHGGELLTFPR
jgi:hypothetical protein